VKFEQEKLVIRIVDDGCGFDVKALSRNPENHYGLLGMRERVERIGGTFTLKSAIGQGTDINVEVPRKAIVSMPASETAL
jgi:signal transduction histidine kinase